MISDFNPDKVLSELSCRDLLIRAVHGDEPSCSCGAPVRKSVIGTYQRGGTVACPCGRRFSWASGTLFSGMKISPQTIVMLALLLSLSVSESRIAETLKIDRETVKLWKIRLGGVE